MNKNCLHIMCGYNKSIEGYRLLTCSSCGQILRVDVEDTKAWDGQYRTAKRSEVKKLIKLLK